MLRFLPSTKQPDNYSKVSLNKLKREPSKLKKFYFFLAMLVLVSYVSLSNVDASHFGYGNTGNHIFLKYGEKTSGLNLLLEPYGILESIPDKVIVKSGKATITKEMLIVLDDSAPIQTEYIIDISHLTFEDEKSAVSFFDRYRDNLVQIKVDFKDKAVILQLFHEHVIGTPWGVSQWNAYLMKKAKNLNKK